MGVCGSSFPIESIPSAYLFGGPTTMTNANFCIDAVGLSKALFSVSCYDGVWT